LEILKENAFDIFEGSCCREGQESRNGKHLGKKVSPAACEVHATAIKRGGCLLRRKRELWRAESDEESLGSFLVRKREPKLFGKPLSMIGRSGGMSGRREKGTSLGKTRYHRRRRQDVLD